MHKRSTVYVLRREPLYHKLQYSKTPKFDAPAAAFGVTVGAFGVYLGLSSLGSMGADLTDLTVLCWYVALWIGVFLGWLRLSKETASGARVGGGAFGLFIFECGAAVMKECRVVLGVK